VRSTNPIYLSEKEEQVLKVLSQREKKILYTKKKCHDREVEVKPFIG